MDVEEVGSERRKKHLVLAHVFVYLFVLTAMYVNENEGEQ